VKHAVCIALAASLVAACHGRERTETGSSGPSASQPTHGPSIATFDVSQGLPEEAPGSVLGLGPRRSTFHEALRALEKVKRDRSIRGVLVRFGGASLGLARAGELADALAEIRRDKPVTCHAEAFGNASYMAAARGCSKIVVSPAGDVDTVGLAAQILYVRKLLADELHFQIDILQVGKFKGAEEPMTRDGPSPEARASLESVLADFRGTWLDGVKEGRKAAAAGVVEDGPYPARRAKELGLIDEIAYFDEARDAARHDVGAVRDDARFGPGVDPDEPSDFDDVLRELAAEGGGGAEPVALIRATGEITMSGSGGVLGGRGGITERGLGRLVQRAEHDDSIKAVVLRIDSPGGSALASDLLWHQLMKLRAKKPLVVSVGEMAASGGYYIASTASVIYADPASIVGSIGVVGGKVAVGDALERLGVHTETFPAKVGDPRALNRAAYQSPLLAWDDATKARVLESMTGIYELFLARVAEGRNIPVEKVAASAEGRIFSGAEGKRRGLVDEVGGLSAAIAKARELAKLRDDALVGVLDHKPTFLDALGGQDPGASEELAAAPAPWSPPTARDVVARIAPDLVPFVASIAPIVQGERTLAAIPYALVVR